MSRADRRQRLYLRLPYPAKVAAASAQGLRLRRRRYGVETDGLVAAALERDRWDADHWAEWQDARLAEVLGRAARLVPAHRRWFREHADRDPARLEDWPVLTKQALRDRPNAFRAEGLAGPVWSDWTSGTSGTPLEVPSTRSALRRWFALYEARARGWHGVSRKDRWAILGGQVIAAPDRTRPPFWAVSPPLRQLYLSSHHVAPTTVGSYVEVLRRFGPSHLVVYPSSAAALARIGLDAGLTAGGPQVVLTNAEAVTPAQRAVIEAFFECPARETYGMAEMAAGASECEHGTRHAWPDAGVVEVLDDDDRPVGPGQPGRLVLTGLVNDALPLVRYDIGDRGRRPEEDEGCECGRGLPVMPAIEGRDQDLIVTPDGRRVFWLNPVFTGLPVAEAQVVQAEAAAVSVAVVPAAGYEGETAAVIADRLRDRLGAMTVTVETTDALPRTAAGKLRPIVNTYWRK